jgi:hypothetical protein
MRKRLIKICLPLMVLAMSLGGLFSPREARAFGGVGVCNYFCLDPELTCCITCYWEEAGQCVCPQYCIHE